MASYRVSSLITEFLQATGNAIFSVLHIGGATGPKFSSGISNPEGVVLGKPADVYLNTSGGKNETIWYKATGINTNTGWQPVVSSGGGVSNETPAGAVNGINKTFTVAYAYLPASANLYINGLKQKPIADYVESRPVTLVLTDAPLTGDLLSVDYERAT